MGLSVNLAMWDLGPLYDAAICEVCNIVEMVGWLDINMRFFISYFNSAFEEFMNQNLLAPQDLYYVQVQRFYENME